MDKFHVGKEEFSNRTFRLPNDLLEELGQVAQQRDVSVNRLVLLCCRYALDHLDQEVDQQEEKQKKKPFPGI